MIGHLVQHLLVALITGSGGYLGGHVVETFLAAGYRTVIVARRNSLALNEKAIESWKESYPSNLEVIECDLSTRATSLEDCLLNSGTLILEDIDCIINCASPFMRSCINQLEAIVEPTLNIADNIMTFAAAVRRSQVNDTAGNKMQKKRNLRVVHVSSSAALRGPGQKPYRSTTDSISSSVSLLSANSKESSCEDYVSPPLHSGGLCVNSTEILFSPLDWNTCSKMSGSGMQPYQFAKTVSEQIIFESGIENDIDVVSIVPVTMLGPICNAQYLQLRVEKSLSDYLKDTNESLSGATDGGEERRTFLPEGQRALGREVEGGVGQRSGGGVSAQFIEDWKSCSLKQENRLIADVRDVSLAILRAAEIDLKIIEMEANPPKKESEKNEEQKRNKKNKNGEDKKNSPTIPENVVLPPVNYVDENINPTNIFEYFLRYDLESSSVRNRMFFSRRFIIGGSRRVEHSAVGSILQLHGYSGGSLIISDEAVKLNAFFRTDIDEIDTSATSRSAVEGGLGLIIRPWEETILDAARQFYNS